MNLIQIQNKSSLKKKNTEEKKTTQLLLFLLLRRPGRGKKKNTKKEAKLMVLNANFHDDARIIQIPPYVNHIWSI